MALYNGFENYGPRHSSRCCILLNVFGRETLKFVHRCTNVIETFDTESRGRSVIS